MKKVNQTISIFTSILLLVSFIFAPVNLVFAEEATSEKTSEKTTPDSNKDADKKKKEKGKGKKGNDDEEPECE